MSQGCELQALLHHLFDQLWNCPLDNSLQLEYKILQDHRGFPTIALSGVASNTSDPHLPSYLAKEHNEVSHSTHKATHIMHGAGASSSKLTRPAYPTLAGRPSMSHYWPNRRVVDQTLICHLPLRIPSACKRPLRPGLAGTGGDSWDYWDSVGVIVEVHGRRWSIFDVVMGWGRTDGEDGQPQCNITGKLVMLK